MPQAKLVAAVLLCLSVFPGCQRKPRPDDCRERDRVIHARFDNLENRLTAINRQLDEIKGIPPQTPTSGPAAVAEVLPAKVAEAEEADKPPPRRKISTRKIFFKVFRIFRKGFNLFRKLY